MNRLPLFSFGSLMDDDVLAVVCGPGFTSIRKTPAILEGFQSLRVPDETYPTLIESYGNQTEGVLLEIHDEDAWQRILFFESDEYGLARCSVSTPNGRRDAIYFKDDNMMSGASEPWTLAEWQQQHKPRFLNMIKRYMACFEAGDLDAAERLWDEMNER